MKRLIVVFFLCYMGTLCAQNTSFDAYRNQKHKEFEQYRQQRRTDFENYRAQRNKEFADYLAQRWVEFQHFRGVKMPPCPDPVKPVIKQDDDSKSQPVKIPVKKIVVIPKPLPHVPLTSPVAPAMPEADLVPSKRLPEQKTLPSFYATFYNNRCYVNLSEKQRFSFTSIDEQALSSRWTWLSDGRMDKALNDCLLCRDEMHLCDYAYVQMLREICCSFFGKENRNEAVFMQLFLLAQSGYDVKCARKNEDLVLMITADQQIYQMSYLKVEGQTYYLVDDTKSEGGYYTFSQKFSKQSQCCSMMIQQRIEFTEKHLSDVRQLTAKRYPQLNVKTQVDRNLMAFYTNYPHCSWEMYANTPMSQLLADRILPSLKEQVTGKSAIEAANMLINFVQTAFEYMTDDEQFGYERPFFTDETFYYPYSDCEDRAILYSNLIRNLLHLDVVLLHYPNHLATAVRFHSDIQGDYVMVDGQKYIVCDPTYIGAPIGEAMPKFKNSEVEVVKL